MVVIRISRNKEWKTRRYHFRRRCNSLRAGNFRSQCRIRKCSAAQLLFSLYCYYTRARFQRGAPPNLYTYIYLATKRHSSFPFPQRKCVCARSFKLVLSSLYDSLHSLLHALLLYLYDTYTLIPVSNSIRVTRLPCAKLKCHAEHLNNLILRMKSNPKIFRKIKSTLNSYQKFCPNFMNINVYFFLTIHVQSTKARIQIAIRGKRK